VENQKVLDVLNSLEVVEKQGGEDSYILVDSTKENLQRLNDVGVDTETILKYGDDNAFCVLALAFNEGYANDYDNKLVYKPAHVIQDNGASRTTVEFDGEIVILKQWNEMIGETAIHMYRDEFDRAYGYVVDEEARKKGLLS